MKMYDKRDDFTFPIVNFLFFVATFLQHRHMEFIYHSLQGRSQEGGCIG